jgi:hypothetical protein
MATRTDRSGTAVARAGEQELLGDQPLPPGIAVDAEETAIFPDLVFADPRLIVLTGAQRPADAPDSDGPRTLADAITVAAHPATRGPGTLIVFGGAVLPARGTARESDPREDGCAARVVGGRSRTRGRRSWPARVRGGGGGLRQRGASRRRLPGTRHCYSRVIRSATGQGVIVDSATALWTALLSQSEVPADLLLGLPARLDRPTGTAALTPVAVAMAGAAAATAVPPCRAVS